MPGSGFVAEPGLVAVPAQLQPGAGRFQALEIRAPKGLQVQAPRDYYIAPPWAKTTH